ncbi:MAG: DNA recombination protein RmuC [Candidatus Omnitrophica bacterium]|nr:DNA recombination protein RmuC [Candidatus Omnitrophota bacterium]
MEIYLLFTILILLLAVFLFLIFKSLKNRQDILMHQKIDSLREEFTKNSVWSQNLLDSSKSVTTEISRLYEKIGGLDKESRQILELTQSFHDVLKPTKLRGIVGESILENLLFDTLPKESIISQYRFKDGKKVDFAIKLIDLLVPIDAKFSMESFRNFAQSPDEDRERQRRICIESIKKRINETAGYIYPDEGTTDFALMYIPSEAVYYFIITETSLLEAASAKKVFVVGPNTFYAYLKTIVVGFQALQIEEKAKEIYNNLKRLEKELSLFIRDYGLLGNHIRNSSSKYEEGLRRIDKISAKIQSMGEDQVEDKGQGYTQSQEAENRGI